MLVYISRQVLHLRDKLFQFVIVNLKNCCVCANVLEHQFILQRFEEPLVLTPKRLGTVSVDVTMW